MHIGIHLYHYMNFHCHWLIGIVYIGAFIYFLIHRYLHFDQLIFLCFFVLFLDNNIIGYVHYSTHTIGARLRTRIYRINYSI